MTMLPELPETRLSLRPMFDRVAIRAIERETVSKGGIHIPDTASEAPVQGLVIAVGPGRMNPAGTAVIPPVIKRGDRVVYGKYAGSIVEVDGEEVVLVREVDILAVVEEAAR